MSGPKWSQFANAIQELENSVPDFTVDIRCPKCSDEYDVSRVRRVDLLYDISRELHTKVSPVQVAADDTSDAYSGQEAFDIDERASSAPGPVSPPRTAPTSKRESSLSTSNSNHEVNNATSTYEFFVVSEYRRRLCDCLDARAGLLLQHRESILVSNGVG
jgi:hypothetical protein